MRRFLRTRHASTIFVTGGTGQTGAIVCERLDRTWRCRARVGAHPNEAVALSAIGVDVVKGDITDAEGIRRAAQGEEGLDPGC